MKKISQHRPVFIVLALGLVLTGCASSPEPVVTVEPVVAPHIEYVVQRGDRLSEIAQTFTGDGANWRAIATANNIKNPRNLREGSILVIPQSILPKTQSTPLSQEPKRQPTPVSSPMAVKRASTDEANVVVTAIPKQREFELNPLQQNPTKSNTRALQNSGLAQSIKVIGSYYPKGIYLAPQTSSRLLMRVNPGTTFSLEATIDGWFKVTTEQGSGFIRHSDATVVSAE